MIADAAGADLFIQVTCLRDAEGDQPPLWHVSVNNPLDQPVTATLRRAMDLPGLAFSEQPVTLQPGEYRVLEHPDA